jgi:non-ribosomal peptide synthetase component E (peptide arylation enzyme)
VPDYVVFMDDFPRTATKKANKAKLREMMPSLLAGLHY